MKMKNILYLIASLAVAGWMFASCENNEPHGGKTEPEPETEMGYFSFGIALDNMHATRDAGGEVNGVPQESQLNSLRLIFYNTAGKAELVESYMIQLQGNHYEMLNEWGAPLDEVLFGTDNTVAIPSNELDKVVITRNPIQLKKQNYQLAVLLNNFGQAGGFNIFHEPVNLESSTRNAEHNISVLTGALDLHTGWELMSAETNIPSAPYDVHLGLLNTMLGGVAVNSGWSDELQTIGDYEGKMDNLSIFMSNADGLTYILKNDLADTPEAAPTKVVYVDRSLAKVALVRNAAIRENNGVYTVPSGGRVDGMYWVPDIINSRMFFIRQFGLLDNANTPRVARYATDPNFKDVSLWDPNPMVPTAAQKRHFFYLSDAYDPQTRTVQKYSFYRNPTSVDPFEKTWAPDNQALLDSCMWYYLTENTMAAEEQWEDVTTRIVARCHYAPGRYECAGAQTLAIGESYYYFWGMAFTHDQLIEYLTSGGDKYGPELEGLYDLLDDQEVLDAFGWSRESLPVAPTASVSCKELAYYHQGLNYYSILIRHFSDAEQPVPMAYGRYGVVRNNVYNITIDDIYGPGSIGIPDPTGPDDKDPVVKVTISVKPWKTVPLHFEF